MAFWADDVLWDDPSNPLENLSPLTHGTLGAEPHQIHGALVVGHGLALPSFSGGFHAGASHADELWSSSPESDDPPTLDGHFRRSTSVSAGSKQGGSKHGRGHVESLWPSLQDRPDLSSHVVDLASHKPVHIDMHLKPACTLPAAAATGVAGAVVGKAIVAERAMDRKTADDDKDLNIFGNHIQPCHEKSHCDENDGVCVWSKYEGGRCLDADNLKTLMANEDRIKCISTSCHVAEDASPEALQLITEKCAGRLRDCQKRVVAQTMQSAARRRVNDENWRRECAANPKWEGCQGTRSVPSESNGPINDHDPTEPDGSATLPVHDGTYNVPPEQEAEPQEPGTKGGSMPWLACTLSSLVRSETLERTRRCYNEFL